MEYCHHTKKNKIIYLVTYQCKIRRRRRKNSKNGSDYYLFLIKIKYLKAILKQHVGKKAKFSFFAYSVFICCGVNFVIKTK